MEMNIQMNGYGKWVFLDNLQDWGKRFINGENYWVDVAGTQKMQADDIEMELDDELDDPFSISFSPGETEMLQSAEKENSIRKRIKIKRETATRDCSVLSIIFARFRPWD